MPDRYFVTPPVDAARAVLRGDEAHHLTKVMRAKPGDEIIVFDGGGCEWRARVAAVQRGEIALELLERHEMDRELGVAVTLAIALPKGDRQRWLVEKSVELGVRRLVPLITDRGVAQPVDNALSRLRRTVVEASKQCGRNRLMEIAAPQPWTGFCAAVAAPGEHRVMADPSGSEDVGNLLAGWRTSRVASSLVFAVGPEGGWTEGERHSAASHGLQMVSLGPRILRVETAALLLASMAVSAVIGFNDPEP
ncbi:MAG TPA: RsmE family RNA methyltransferase [Pirellulales bacterium]|nr:RsmE family RNA methyltransferase [Pirellulales bacterium]